MKYFKFLTVSVLSLFIGVSVANAQNYTFSNDLTLGSSGPDVESLQTWLIGNGYDIPAVSSGIVPKGYFGVQTRIAVQKYQTAAGIRATGYVGPLTRVQLNRNGILIDKENNVNPIINGLDAPTALMVGQTGTWTIRAGDPSNGTLSYSVDWGDISYTTPAGYSATPSSPSFSQSSTFDHSYSMAGTYTITFTVKNASGKIAKTKTTVQVGQVTNTANLKITAPNGGEVWTKGTMQVITWTAPAYFRATYADIRLISQAICPTGYSCLPIPPTTIASHIDINQNSYNWNIGQNISDGQYTIQICESGTSNCDTSDKPFTISSVTSGVPDINITSPNGGETWVAEELATVNVDITGDATRVGNYISTFLVDRNNQQTFLGNLNQGISPGNKSITIQIPAIQALGTYKVLVHLYMQPLGLPVSPTLQAYDYSDGYITVTNHLQQLQNCPVGYTCTPNRQ